VGKYKSDKKTLEIQNAIASGESREEVARRFGYKSWKGLDIYMRRKGMMWSSRLKIYYDPSNFDFDGFKKPPITGEESPKILSIISMFEKDHSDPMGIAKKNGFKDHREMASYMAARGYTWSFEHNNYIKSSESSNNKHGNPDNTLFEKEASQDAAVPLNNDFSRYIPLLELMLKNKDKFYKFLQSSSETIPRYVVPGISRTKSFYMSDRLSNLIAEFSTTFNISQKEIIETALIEFFKKYSFREEVEHILQCR